MTGIIGVLKGIAAQYKAKKEVGLEAAQIPGYRPKNEMKEQSNSEVSNPPALVFSGQREARTPDTRIFSPLLYQLSYLS